MKRACNVPCILLLSAFHAASGRSSSPVERVVNLLRDLKDRLEQDGRDEKQVYEKYACWCTGTTSRKATAIADARDELTKLGQSILKLKGSVATLMSEIEKLAKDISDNEEAQAKATTTRRKENTLYLAETTEMKEVIASLGKALAVLKEDTGDSFLQRGTSGNAALRAVIDLMPSTAPLRPRQASLLRALASAAGGAHYSPQSATIVGILDEMYTTMGTDLETATTAEGKLNRDYEKLISSKQEQLKLLQEQVDTKQKEKAKAESMLADQSQSFDDTEDQMKADVEFFDETKKGCESKHKAWTERSKLRKEELEGITKALDILSSDAARKLFASAIKPGKEIVRDPTFLQLASGGSLASPAAHAYVSLKASATKTGSLRLAALAARLREAKKGHFDDVIKAIDLMVKTLKDEAVADAKKRDQCVSEFHKAEKTIAETEWLIKKNKAEIDKLQDMIEDLEDQQEVTGKDIKDLKEDIDDMEKQRKAENDAFKAAKKEDEDAIKLLKQAKDVLTSYYKKNNIELGPIQGNAYTLAQSRKEPEFEVSPDQAPDADFSDKGSRKLESKGIVQIMTMLIEDLGDEIKNGIKDEATAQADYDKAHATATKLLGELEQKLINLKDSASKRKQEKGDEEKDMGTNQAALDDETSYVAKIKPDCDWVIDTFAKRAKHRVAEMEGLSGAKEFLSGYTPGEQALIARQSQLA